MVRIKDKFPGIRIQAVMALIRLQDPTDEECPVIDAFLRSLETDINADVRKTIILNIALSRKTLPYVLGIFVSVNIFRGLIFFTAYYLMLTFFHHIGYSIFMLFIYFM